MSGNKKQKPKKHFLLIKKGIKSVFATKLFSIILFIIVLITGATYTMIETSSSSLSKSYDQVVNNGKLADYVVKQNFIPSSDSSLELGIVNTSKPKDIYDFTKNNFDAYKKTNGEKTTVTLGIKELKGDYSALPKNETKTVSMDSKNSEDIQFADLKDAKDNWESELKVNSDKLLSKQFTDKLNSKYGANLIAKNTRSLSVAFGFEAFKVVDSGNVAEQEKDINSLQMYDGTNLFSEAASDKKMTEQLKHTVESKRGIDTWKNWVNSLSQSKEFKYVVSSGQTGVSHSVVDPSAYEAIVSPAWANANLKKAITRSEMNEILEDNPKFMDDVVKKSSLRNKYDNNLVFVDQTPFFIIGVGVTPDFVTPIIDQEHPTIDVKNQAIVYTNDKGYARVYDAFRGNPVENYTALRFKSGVPASEKTKIINEIEKDIKNNSGVYPNNQWPKNVKVITSVKGDSDQVLLSYARVKFLRDLHGIIESISYATTTLLFIFVLAIITLIFKVLININRKSYATLLALGYSKTKIAMSNSVAALLLVGIPTIVGYLVGFGLQYWFTNIFRNYWTIPTYGEALSWVSLGVVVGVPLVLSVILIMAVSLFELRHSITNMLSNDNDVKVSLMSKMISKRKYLGIKTKYALGLVSKNIGKLLLLALAATISATALIVGFGSVGKASQAYNATTAVNKYNFHIDLYTPTEEGGQYQTVDKDNLKPGNRPRETYGPLNSVDTDKWHWHIPSAADKAYATMPDAGSDANIEVASKYLKNKLQTKTLLEEEIAGLKPWALAEKLMPENQRNIANNDAKDTNNNVDHWKVISDRLDNNDLPYILSYNQVIYNERDDEKYTHIDANVNNSESDPFNITGLQDNTKMISIDNDLLDDMNKSTEELPIVVNKYIQAKYKLNKGSYINLIVNNDTNRNYKSHKEHNVKAKVIGFINSYDNTGIFTTQDKANKLIGLDKMETKDSKGRTIKGFNGVFSKSEKPAILGTLPLYSPSGLYPPIDSINSTWEPVISKMLKNDKIWNSDKRKGIAADVDEFKKIYSTSPLVSTTGAVTWKEINKTTFANVSHLASTIIWIIEIISIALSIMFTIIVTSLLFKINNKKIATLWTLGYRKHEVAKIFLATFVLPMVIAIGISIPVAFGLLKGLTVFVMGFGNILIPFAVSVYMPFLALCIIALIFVITTLWKIYRQKQEQALEAFKGV